MSVSSIDIRKSIVNLEPKDNNENPFHRKIKKQISLQNDNIQKEIFKKLNEGCVLKYIRSTERKESVKTNFSDSDKELKYDLCMINKFDENLNTSLSYISEFDLEADEDELDKSFNSCDSENSVERIEIFEKNNKKNIYEDDEEHNTKLEKEWNDIQELLLNKNSS
jgi:hypothetical protein